MSIRNLMKFKYLLLLLTLLTPAQGQVDHNIKALSGYSCIFIYQFAKVGSTSLLYLFKPFCPTIHTHQPEPIFKMMEEKKRFLIINAMRNLFDRNISAFFHHARAGIVKNLPKKESYLLAELLEAFPSYNHWLTQDTVNWYSNFNRQFGLHIFDKPFNKYHFERRGLFDVLIVRFEDIEEWTEIFEKVLNLEDLNLEFRNERKDPIYQNFKKIYRFSKEDADLMTSLDYMQHFYTKEELLYFKREYL